jgi:hypothetical protein
MAARNTPIIVHLATRRSPRWSSARRREPITIGIPLPRSLFFRLDEVALHNRAEVEIPAQLRALDFWSDGSIRWLLLDFEADVDAQGSADHALLFGSGAAAAGGVRVSQTSAGEQVSTGIAIFDFSVGGSFPLSHVTVDGRSPVVADRSGLTIVTEGQTQRCHISGVTVRESGPLRAELDVRGRIEGQLGDVLELLARVELFAGSATGRFDVTLRNRRRARHRGGQWSLGDPGSVLLDALTWSLAVAEPTTAIHCAAEYGGPVEPMEAPFEIFQASSGGENWNSRAHVDRDGKIPLAFAGYRLRDGNRERFGRRATPIVIASSTSGQLSVTMPQFWQNFPRSVSVNEFGIEVGLFPRQCGYFHELQGGEQKTHQVVIAFGPDAVSEVPLAWCQDPSWIGPSPDWFCASAVIPFLVPAAAAPDSNYQTLVDSVLDATQGFVAKREAIDEYGWRHFGDLFADHESAYRKPGESLFVSHYNNQYDALAGFIVQLFRTGDLRWWELMADLVRHVRDIDIYHTLEDKPAYNGGLFWHTAHYIDAGTSTHRTYPDGSALSGGPSSEHNYANGLMLHYFLTGDRASRDAAIGLAEWVIEMDDGQRTPFRWLARGATGLASATGSTDYHGPGRAAANSILACLWAFRLTQERRFAEKMEELIRRCIHPNDDIVALNLLDVERRWYYTVFLQALGMVLDDRQERGQLDGLFAYMRTSLLQYARWMVPHEHPYLDRPEVLEFPNHTWAAQDARKAEVFMWAALHAQSDERATFLERARFFRQYSIGVVASTPGRFLTRPLVLLISNGVRWEWFERHAAALPAPWPIHAHEVDGPRSSFVPQRARAVRRAKMLATIALIVVVLAIVLLVAAE